MMEYVCDCQECRDMCFFPCMGTVDEMQAIVNAGYSSKLAVSEDNHQDLDFTVVKPRRENKRCVFFDDGCQLHDAGLKPLEGRIAIHGDQITGKTFYSRLARSWNTNKGRALIKRIRHKDIL